MPRIAALLALCGCAPVSEPATPAPSEPSATPAERWAVPAPRAIVALAAARVADEHVLVVAAADGELRALSASGAAVDTGWAANLTAPVAVDANGSAVWIAEAAALHRIDSHGAAPRTVSLPEGTRASSIAVGYGDTVFIADAGSNRILVSHGDSIDTFVEDAALNGPTPLLLQGGTLFVGGRSELLAVDLATAAKRSVAKLPQVRSLVSDHRGTLIAAVEGRGLVRISPDGTSSSLTVDHRGPLAFDAGARTLYATNATGDRLVATDYVELTGEDPAWWAKADARPMRAFEHDGIALSGAEYWPYRGDKEPDYPADILWGFYPEKDVVFEGDRSPASATPEAIACAELSFAALRSWVAAAPPSFRAAVQRGASSRFYLWVNDYSQASEPWPHDVRPARLWYWQRKPSVAGRVPGYWKWETTLTQDGACTFPEETQINAYLADFGLD